MKFTSPLAIYIIWHPNYSEGQVIADYLYSVFCRDTKKPLNKTLGIPVYFRKINFQDQNHPLMIDFDESEYTAVIPLINDDFVLDKGYNEYIEKILEETDTGRNKAKVYPVAISKSAYSSSEKLSKINFLRAYDEMKTKQDLFSFLRLNLTHELCRLLLEMKKAVDENEKLSYNAPPIKLFISHSKHDDFKYEAIKFRDYINSETQLKTFFDANDISYGSCFGDEIKKGVNGSALVAFQSDSYSDREWCRIELLTAKQFGCPVVIVNAIENGEKRTFPYMGNYPSIRLNNNFKEIICLTIEQVLYNNYTRRLLDQTTDLYDIKTDSILSSYPELYSFIQLKERIPVALNEEGAKLVIYPDPPLGTEETDLLKQMDSSYFFVTPTTLPSLVFIK